MEPPSQRMEEIFAIPVKYIESWLDLKENGKFKQYWVVLKTHYIFIFKDNNTHAREQYVGFLNIEVGETKCTAKKPSKWYGDFFVEISKKKKFQFRVKFNEPSDDILLRRWLYAIDLVIRAEPPEPLPGDLDFKERTVFTPGPDKMKPRSQSVPVIPPIVRPPRNKSGSCDSTAISSTRPTSVASSLRKISIQEAESETYDPIFIPPSWCFNISRNEAMQFLNGQRVGTYLLRTTETNRVTDNYSLSIKDSERIKHHKIKMLPHGQWYFEGSEDKQFTNPTEAVQVLMKTTYAALYPQCIQSREDRASGDGEEDETQKFFPSEISSPGYDAAYESSFSPVTPSFGGHFPDTSPDNTKRQRPTKSYTLPPSLTSPVSFDDHLPIQRNRAGSIGMNERHPTGVYENSNVVQRHRRSNDSYVDMQLNIANNNETEDAPPPLPCKRRQSLRRQSDHDYVNLPVHGHRKASYDAS